MSRFDFWLGWVLVTALGWTVGWLAVKLLVPAGGGAIPGVVGILPWAIPVGIAQWLLLRGLGRFDESGWWIIASLPGALIVGPLAGTTATELMVIGWGVGGAIVGAVVGLSQSLVLSKAISWKALLWVPASGFGWGVGWLSAAVLAGALSSIFGARTSAELAYALGWTASAAVTGLVLAWLLLDGAGAR